MKKIILSVAAAMLIFTSCEKNDSDNNQVTEISEDFASFREIGSLSIGGAGAAEISAYDEVTKKLFTVNNSNTNQIDVIDVSDPAVPKKLAVISLASYNEASNSVAVYNGKLAVALESTVNKQDNGKVVVFNTNDYSLIKEITVGALPDMVTFSPDGKYIVTANEGEPNADYSVDPDGSISIISVDKNYQVVTLNFEKFAPELSYLKLNGFRIATKAKTFAADIEPEYVTISADSKTAWVTLQENNAMAKVDLDSKKISSLFGLGYKSFNSSANGIDVSDRDNTVAFTSKNIKGMYMPDGIASYTAKGINYLITANEGDAREYTGYADVARLSTSTFVLDPTAFPTATALKAATSLGRLNLVTTEGDLDKDGDFDELISMGARSFTIWNGDTGALVFDSKNDLDKRSNTFGTYDDARSDDKGAEPEAVVVAKMNGKSILFVGLERTDAVMIYDITNPVAPVFLQAIKTGDAPEGIQFIPASKSPNKRSLLIVSSEGDGVVKFFQPNLQ